MIRLLESIEMALYHFWLGQIKEFSAALQISIKKSPNQKTIKIYSFNKCWVITWHLLLRVTHMVAMENGHNTLLNNNDDGYSI